MEATSVLPAAPQFNSNPNQHVNSMLGMAGTKMQFKPIYTGKPVNVLMEFW